MSSGFANLIASSLGARSLQNKTVLFWKKSGKDRVTTLWEFCSAVFSRNPLGICLISIVSRLKHLRFKSRLYLAIALVVLLLLVLSILVTPYTYCLNNASLYARHVLNRQSRYLFPREEHVSNSCPFCQDVKLHLSCYQADLTCKVDKGFLDKRETLCDCNCGAFGHASSSVDAKQRLGILFFTTYSYMTSKKGSSLFHYYQAIKSLPNMEAHLFGPGFEEYDNMISLEENLAKSFPDTNFNVIFVQVPSAFRFPSLIYDSLKRLSKDLTVVFRFHECRYGICDEHISRSGTSLVLFSYARDIAQYQHHSDKVLLVHQPHVVHPPLFRNNSVESKLRKINVLFVGGSGIEYPFGRRLYHLIKEKKIEGAQIYESPPPLADAKDLSTSGSQYNSYLRTLESSKVVIVTSSFDNLLLMKHGEIALSGALIAGDIPLGYEAELRGKMLELRPQMSDSEIIALLGKYVQETQSRKTAILLARQLFLSKYTTWNQFDILRQLLELTNRGVTGLIYPHYYVKEDLLDRPSCTAFYFSDIMYILHSATRWLAKFFV